MILPQCLHAERGVDQGCDAGGHVWARPVQPREFTLVLPSNLGVLSLIGRSPATNVITATKEFGNGAEPPIWAPILAISATIGAQKHHDRFGREYGSVRLGTIRGQTDAEPPVTNRRIGEQPDCPVLTPR